MTNHFSSITLWNYYNWCWPNGSTAVYDFWCKEFLNFVFHPLIIHHGNQVWFLGNQIRGSCINGHFCVSCCYGCSHLWQIEKHILSGVQQVCIQCWASVCGEVDGNCPAVLVQPSFFEEWHYFLSEYLADLWYVYHQSHYLLWWVQGILCILLCWAFKKLNVFVCIIRHQNIKRCFTFDAVDAIEDVNIRVPFVESSSVIKLSHMFLNCLTCDLNWYNTIVSRQYFKDQFNNSCCCLLFTVSCICKEFSFLLYVIIFIPCSKHMKLRTSFECQLEKLSPCLAICHKGLNFGWN